MILVALGANLPSQYGTPSDTLKMAVKAIESKGIIILKSARVWLTAPVPFNLQQDWYHNSLVSVETNLSPHDLLSTLLNIEKDFGRVRDVKNAPRILDLDLIAYNDEIIMDGDKLIIPHPRMHKRLFVLKPLVDIDENWAHPQLKQNVNEMIALCSKDQQAKVME